MQDETNESVPSANYMQIDEIKKTCENLISQSQIELDHFKHEQHQLRSHIEEILVENKKINTKLEVIKATKDKITADSREDATREKLTNDALLNVKKQIDFLEAENNELRSLNKSSRKTIENLENEIQNYRNHLCKSNTVSETKQKYETALKLLESTIKTKETEIARQAQIIENLFKQKKQLNEHTKNLEKAFEEKERYLRNVGTSATIDKLQTKLGESEQQIKKLQLSLKMAKGEIEQRFEREKCALQKVQEALSIAEAAVADKDNAHKRERVVKEECDNLASTIGQVMDEAAKKVEKDMDDLRRKFSEKELSLLETQNQMKEEMQNQQKFNQILEARCNRFQQKYKASIEEIERLTQQLESAVKAVVEMEAQINKQESLIKKQEIFLRYKNALSDITKKFENQIYRLQKDNAELKAGMKLSN